MNAIRCTDIIYFKSMMLPWLPDLCIYAK